jgi:predicted nucleic acid-binding protein
VIVVDTTMICYLLIEGDYTELAERTYAADPDWIAPHLWLSEFRNVLRTYIAGGFLSLEQVMSSAVAAELLMMDRSFSVTTAEVLRLASLSGCSAYDCEYVALARSLSVKLVTTEKKLLRAFPDTAVHPVQF